MAHKIQLTAKNCKDFRTNLNTEYKGFNACIKFLIANWNNKEIQEMAKADGLNKSDISAEYIKKHLEGTNWVNNGVMGHMITTEKGDKAKGIPAKREFSAEKVWTPGKVWDYVRRASNAHCKELGI